VEEADRDPGWAATAAAPDPDPRAPFACAVAAVRECFEETGILCAVDGAGRPATPELARALAPVRDRLRDGDAGALRPALTGLGLRPDLGGLVFCAHWITPAGLTRRYDTRFYLALAPPGQDAARDARGEHVGHAWAEPEAALARGLSGAWQLLPPTRALLGSLAGGGPAAGALAAARRRPIETIAPELGDITPDRVPGLGWAVLRGVHGR
jgi:8-oxo-dGTP pyrophosphatase MutT (NUDIX family)